MAAASLLWLWTASPALGQNLETGSTPAEAVAADTAASVSERIAALEEELRLRKQEAAAALPDSADAAYLDQAVSTLEAIQATLRAAFEIRRRLETPEEPLPSVDDEVSLAALIRWYEARDADERRLSDLRDAEDASREARAAAEARLEEAERARRAARVEHEASPTAAARRTLELSQLGARLAKEKLGLARAELQADRLAEAAIEARRAPLEESLEELRASLRELPELAEAEIAALDRDDQIARKRRAAAERAHQEAEQHQRRLVSEAGDGEAARVALAEAELLREIRAERLSAADAALERVEQRRQILQHWADLLRGRTDAEAVRGQSRETRGLALGLARSLVQRQGRLAELNEQADGIEARLEEADLAAATRASLERRLRAVRDLVSFHISDMAEIARQERLAGYFQRATDNALGGLPLAERLAELGSQVRGLWDREVTSVDDEPITLGNVLVAFLLLPLGYLLSRRLSRFLRTQAETRLSMEPGVGSAIETALFYGLLVTFALIALRSVNVPLTAFAFAGGALAIGVGFGSQNVMNNFISGLILLLERPVRSRDTIEVEGTHGTIEQIGARSTRIRASDGRHIIVPNSFFLENNVVNWTLSDELIRTKVVVGVIYGSPTRLVESLIREVLGAEEKILKRPAPIINFAEFGDNSLNFEIFFWMRARAPMAVEQVKSQIRFAIDDVFREHELVIAFPQRDVHLDTVSPLEVRVVPPAPDSPPDDKP